MSQELLLSKGDIFGAIHGQEEAIKKRIQSIPPGTILHASEHDLIQSLIEEFRLNVPMIKDTDIIYSRFRRNAGRRAERSHAPGHGQVPAVLRVGD
jgi:hypothetical protein